MDIDKREEQLTKRLEQIKKLEEEIRLRESAIKSKETAKKQVLLRLAPTLWDQIVAWAEEECRSVNGQMEYLLREAVKGRFSGK